MMSLEFSSRAIAKPQGCGAQAEWIAPGKADRHDTPDIRKRLNSQRRRARSRQFQNPTARDAHFQAGLS